MNIKEIIKMEKIEDFLIFFIVFLALFIGYMTTKDQPTSRDIFKKWDNPEIEFGSIPAGCAVFFSRYGFSR